jgi:hypothetical protein
MLDGIDLSAFSHAVIARDLHLNRFSQVPKDCGVYVIVRDTIESPLFLPRSGAGWFKQLDPSYPEVEVRNSWVNDARVVYIGKGAGASGLRQRIRQLIKTSDLERQ